MNNCIDRVRSVVQALTNSVSSRRNSMRSSFERLIQVRARRDTQFSFANDSESKFSRLRLPKECPLGHCFQKQ